MSIGYFPQDHTGAIEKGMTAVEWLHQFDPDASRQDIHGLLGQMLFSGEEGLKPTEALSGGETARLLFCRIMLQKPNVLVLDEPTNHLDLESINALNVALQKFEGTVLLVTHDQDLLEEVGTRVWHFDDGRDRRLQGHLRRADRRDGVTAEAQPNEMKNGAASRPAPISSVQIRLSTKYGKTQSSTPAIRATGFWARRPYMTYPVPMIPRKTARMKTSTGEAEGLVRVYQDAHTPDARLVSARLARTAPASPIPYAAASVARQTASSAA